MYKKDNNPTYKALANIEIIPINSIEGADFYNHLKNILPHSDMSEAVQYTLSTSLNFTKGISVIQGNADIFREVVTVNVSYILKNKLTGKKVASGGFARLASFNTTFSPYSNNVYQQGAEKNLAIAASEELRNSIMLFIENNKNNMDK
ncbi:MAG: hypothetical protein P8P83_02080 [Rickettsiaceae bacterium]|nr:hypothetical protein [Rickettsiaceae bacterium]